MFDYAQTDTRLMPDSTLSSGVVSKISAERELVAFSRVVPPHDDGAVISGRIALQGDTASCCEQVA